MKKMIQTVSLAFALALASMSATAQDAGSQTAQDAAAIAARDSVIAQLATGTPYEDIIESLMTNSGMSRASATVFAMVVGGETHRDAFIQAGIDGADSVAEASAIADAVILTAGEGSPAALTAQASQTAYETAAAQQQQAQQQSQPSTSSENNSSSGGGNSISN